MIALCSGSFDPPTLGHLDVIERAARMFDRVIVAVGNNPDKRGLFGPEDRVELLTELCAGWDCEVVQFSGLLVDACREHGATVVVKGVRTVGDFTAELAMAQMNKSMAGVETVLLPTAPQFAFISSSLVKQIAAGGGDASAFVPDLVWQRLRSSGSAR